MTKVLGWQNISHLHSSTIYAASESNSLNNSTNLSVNINLQCTVFKRECVYSCKSRDTCCPLKQGKDTPTLISSKTVFKTSSNHRLVSAFDSSFPLVQSVGSTLKIQALSS